MEEERGGASGMYGRDVELAQKFSRKPWEKIIK